MLKKMKIGKRLILSFLVIAILAGVAGIVSVFVMRNIDHKYSNALTLYGFVQGDIGEAMLCISEAQKNVSNIVSFTDQKLIDNERAHFDKLGEEFDKIIPEIEKSCLSETKAILKRGMESEAKWLAAVKRTLEVGDTTDPVRTAQAQKMLVEEVDPLYEQMLADFRELMSFKVSRGEQLSTELSNNSYFSIIFVVAVVLITVGISVLLGVKISVGISKPINKCVNRINQLIQGDLSTEVPVVDTEDEVKILANATGDICRNLKLIIEDTSSILSEMSNGNFAVGSAYPDAYIGEVRPLLTGILGTIDGVSSLVSEVSKASTQVLVGADQVSNGAQILSQGATEQAASIEELSATISDISQKINDNAQNASKAKSDSDVVLGKLEVSNNSMSDMLVAMNDISEKAGEISKIIKTIDDIAFQTNILALNAAVEAARAGEAGKGFAVVADEVRNLAGKSAEAAKNTANLIAQTVNAVERGSILADTTANALKDVVVGVQTVGEVVSNVSEASDEQATSVNQITIAVDQISSVIQSNSATSEESAASSEELSAQAGLLQSLISKFTISEA